jgi:hypothetical protein
MPVAADPKDFARTRSRTAGDTAPDLVRAHTWLTRNEERSGDGSADQADVSEPQVAVKGSSADLITARWPVPVSSIPVPRGAVMRR